jgi:hypothetical protein
MSSSNEEPMPLPLEVDIPKENLPQFLHVYDKQASAFRNPIPYHFHQKDKCTKYRSWAKFVTRFPIKFVRKYPVPATKDEGMSIPAPLSIRSYLSTYAEVDGDRCTIGQLDLSQERRLDSGSHSYVFLAPFTLPSGAAPSLRGQVAVKLAKAYSCDREMLEKEAMIYDKFPRELQQSTPSSPPIVPKFFGYYTPSCDSADSYENEDGDEEDATIVRRDVRQILQTSNSVCPILLLEPCGEPIKDYMLSKSNR